jgi:acyl-homoserine lactone acylase PvdQ
LTNDTPNAGYGDAWVTTIEFSKPIQAYSILAYGQTGNLASKHSKDQAVLFAKHQMKKVWFTEKELLANLERAYRPGE